MASRRCVIQKIELFSELPSLNEYSNAERTHRKKGATMKRRAERSLITEIHAARLKPVKDQVFLSYHWIMKDKRKDKDNIAFAQKFVQDALVGAGILANDGWKEVEGFSHRFSVDKETPRLILKIEEVGNVS